MLRGILLLLFFFLFFRFLLRVIRELSRPSPPRNPKPGARRDDPLRGGKVIDVDYVEMKPGDKPEKGTR